MTTVNQEQLQIILGGIADAVITTDVEGCVTYLNPTAETLTGWTNPEASGHPLEEVFRAVHGLSREPVANPVSQGERERGVTGLAHESLLTARDGSEWPIEGSANPILDDSGSVSGCVLIFRDATERRAANRVARDSEARNRAILEAALDCIISIDHDDRIIDFNPAAEQTFGYRREEVLGRELAGTIIPPALREQHLRGMARYLATGEHQILNRRLELSAIRADGSEFPVELTVTRIDTEGPPLFTAYLRDITARKRMDQDLRQLANDLSEADQRKNEFLAMLGHELRNPLAPISSALETIRLTGDCGDTVGPAREMMERQVAQMVRLVDDLLDVSRISRGKIDLRMQRTDLVAAVNHALEAARALAVSSGVELTASVPTESLYVEGDAARLTQVVGNLLNNACKFTERGGRVSVALSRDEAQATLRVRDTGIGISPEQMPLIFEMFVQGTPSANLANSGLGVGLTLVKSLVEMHGGTLEAHSPGAGRGSEFVVHLPTLPDLPPAPPQEEPSSSPAVSGRRILVVDDNRDAAEALAELLGLTENETHTAFDGPEAVAAAAALRPEVILMDIGLPGCSGYEACRRIRAEEWGREIIIVAITGWGQDDDPRRSAEAGFDAHLVKPVEYGSLLRLLGRLLPPSAPSV